jgi:hypothetical protein
MGHMHHGGGTGGGMMFGGSPERMGRMIDHMLDGLNANDAQRTQIKQIAAGAGADLKTQMEAGERCASARCRRSRHRRSTPPRSSRCAPRCCSCTSRRAGA